MALTKPVPAVGRARLKILAPDSTSLRGYLSGDGASANHSKAPDGSALTFTANHLEPALAADPTMLEDAFAVAEVNVAGTWTPKGTPYAVAPGTGQVIGAAEGSAVEQSPVSVGALQALASECVVLPTECDDTSPTMRHACGGQELGGNRFLGWQSKGYSESLHPGTWHDAEIYTPATGSAKEGQPENWDAEAAAAEFICRTAEEGGLLLARFDEFTLTERTTVKFIIAGDEGAKLYLDGPNMGGLIVDAPGDETSYTEKSHRRLRLEPGTYRPAAEMTIVDSVGGDGNDSIRFACGTIDGDGNIATVLSKSDASTRVCRQPKSDERPGMSPMEVVGRLLAENSLLGVTGADILLDDKDFTDSLDSAGEAPAPEDCREWVWPLGTSLASVLTDMSEDADFDVTTSFVFRCWLDRGSVGVVATLTPGGDPPSAEMNILDYSWDSDPAGPTRYLTASQDGYDVVVGTAAEVGTRPRFGFFETGASASIARARRNARSAIRQNGNGARRYYKARIMAVAGCVPENDFTVCDVVNGRGYQNLGLDLEVTDIGWEQDEGSVEYVIDMTEA